VPCAPDATERRDVGRGAHLHRQRYRLRVQDRTTNASGGPLRDTC
jgi:hypothetical protein